MTHIDENAILRLADDCRFENARFQRESVSDPIPCFELLRLGIGLLNPTALDHVYAIYLPKMQRWATRYIGFQDMDEDAEFFADGAFINFYRAALGEQFETKFQSLPQIIRFMQVCVLNMVRAYQRKNANSAVPLPETDIADSNNISVNSEFGALWGRICNLLPDPQQQLLARLVFVLDMKPREIIEIEEYRKIWKTVRNISIVIYRIRLKLREDTDLRRWMEDYSTVN